MTADTRIRIAIVTIAVVLSAALVVFGIATRSVQNEPPRVAESTITEDAGKGPESTSTTVEDACEKARVRLLTAKAEEFKPFERDNLREDVEKLCD